MSAGSLARRYARALHQIGTEQGSYEQLGRELRDLADAFAASAELISTLTNPAFARDDRERVLRAVLTRVGASATVVNFTRLLLDRERVSAIPDISRELDRMIDEHAGRVKAIITAAKPLSLPQEQALVRALEARSGKKVQVEKRQDPELLAGVVAQVGDMVYDGSLRTQLQQLKLRRGVHRAS